MQISVVLATYNRVELLRQCVDALLNQDFSPDEYEILVSDDGSSDGTGQYLQDLVRDFPKRICYNHQDHAGPAKARNWGVECARGKYIAFTDDDCVPPKDWLSRINDAFGRYPEVVGVSGYQEADPEMLDENIYAQFEKYANMGDYMVDQQKEHVGGRDFLGGATNNVAYLRQVLLEVGGFDETFPFAASEDADLKTRIVDRGYQMVHIPVKVTHQQQYGFKRLMRQAYIRGVGGRHYNQKHGLPSTTFRFLLSALKVTLRSMRFIVSRPVLIPLSLLYQIQFMRGVVWDKNEKT